MDKFVTATATASGKSPTGQPCKASDVMNYYDGNTVTGLWNYAQHFAMSDNSFGTTFGPSSPGAINLVSGDTGNVGLTINGADTNGDTVGDGHGGLSLISDAQPYYDDCSMRDAASMKGTNIGDELNAAGLSWGWFQGGFRPDDELRHGDGIEPAADEHVHPRPVQGQVRHSAGVGSGPVQRGAPDRRRDRRHRRRHAGADELRQQGRLHPPPRAVPVLRLDGQPAPPAARFAGGDRHGHPVVRERHAAVQHRQPSVRHERLRLARGRDQPRLHLARPSSRGQLPQGARLPGRTRRVLRPLRRAAVHHE